jgi:hypothetical protein
MSGLQQYNFKPFSGKGRGGIAARWTSAYDNDLSVLSGVFEVSVTSDFS